MRFLGPARLRFSNEPVELVRQAGRRLLVLVAVLIAGAAFMAQPARAQAGSTCPPGPTSPPGNVNGTLLLTDTVPGNSNSDATRLALARDAANDQSIVQIACTFTQQTDGKSGTWTSTNGETVTHILVKASTVQQVYAVSSPGTSGNWSTQCIQNNGGQQPTISGIFCYGSPDQDSGTVTIIKRTENGLGAFDFAVTKLPGGAPVDVSVTTTGANNPASSSAISLAPGSYEIAEISGNPAGSVLTGISCTSNKRAPFSGNVGTGKVEIDDLTAGENIECTFVNEYPRKEARLTVIKEVPGNGDQTSFTFANNGPQGPADFALQDGKSQTFTATGQYEISEAQQTGYVLTGITCTGTGANSQGDSVSVPDGKLVVTLDDGDDITCTFTNERRDGKTGSLKVRKVTIGGDDTFNFTATGQPAFSLKNGDMQTFSGLAPGQYTVKEVDLPAGWKLQSVACTGGGNKQGNGITVDVAGNQTVTCTFTNFKEKDERMEDVTKVFIHRRVDNLLTHGPDRARMLQRLQPGEPPVSMKDTPPLKLGNAPAGSSAAFVNPFTPAGEGLFAREDADEQPWSRSTGHASPLLSSISSQLSGLGAGGTSNFKFGTSLSEVREAAIAAEAERQKANLTAAGLSFTGQPYVNPYDTMRQGFDLWIEGHVSRYSDGTGGIGRDGTFRLLYVGADYAIAPGVLIGALVQVDDTREDLDDPTLAGEVEGTGWMAGPYVGIRLLDNLFLDARAAWGRSSNDIWLDDPAAGYRTGSFDTDRWLASANLTGNYDYGPWRLSPQLGIAYGAESYDTYFNSLGQAVEGSRARIGRLTGGAEVGYRIPLDSGAVLEPHIGLTGIWNFDTDDLVVGGVLVESQESRARVEGGLLYRAPTGLAMRAAVSYDGIGADDFEAVSGQMWINVPLN